VPQRVCEDCGDTYDWTVDGRRILYRIRAGKKSALALLDPDSRETKEILRSDATLANARFSVDGQQVLFQETSGALDARLWIAPLKGSELIPRSEWILVTDDPLPYRQACWAPDGYQIYFLSDRDTFRCIWAQRIDPRTKQPRGSPIPVHHFHGSLTMMVPDVRDIGLNAARDRLFFSLIESTGNIWMTKITAQ
jgi:hypothetical protein